MGDVWLAWCDVVWCGWLGVWLVLCGMVVVVCGSWCCVVVWCVLLFGWFLLFVCLLLSCGTLSFWDHSRQGIKLLLSTMNIYAIGWQ